MSAGCRRSPTAKQNMTKAHVMPNTGWTKHGHCINGIISTTYQIWASMVKRCANPNCHAYKDYGGRGITVCEGWMKFENFLQDMGQRPMGLQLERRNNSLGYFKDNCYWATRKQQARNKRNTRVFTAFGVTACLPELCERFGISNRIVQERLRRYHWTLEKSLTTPSRQKARSEPPDPASD